MRNFSQLTCFIASCVFMAAAFAQTPQVIDFPPMADRLTNAGGFTPIATGGGSGNPVTFVSLTGKVCAMASPRSAFLTGMAGTCKIRASQAGSATHLPAPDVERSFEVAPADPVVPIVATVAGRGVQGFDGDGGHAAVAHLRTPSAVAIDAAGNVFFIDQGNHRIRKIAAADGVITTVAGNGTAGYSGDGGPAVNAQFDNPMAIAVDAAGNLIVADTYNDRVRMVIPGGIVKTIAGNGDAGNGGDGGPGDAAELFTPKGVAVDALGNVYIADADNRRIRKLSAAGIMSTLAGTGNLGFAEDGSIAAQSPLGNLGDLAVDGAGNVYYVDAYNGTGRIRKVDPNGVLSTVAGGGTLTGSFGDGHSARLANLGDVLNLALDASGNLYVTQGVFHLVRKITPAGKIYGVTTFSNQAFANGVPAYTTHIRGVGGLATDAVGDLYLVERNEHRVRKITFTPPSLPAAPVLPNPAVGNAYITLNLQAAYAGNSEILDFTVTCGSETRTVTTPSVTFAGLTNGAVYNCSAAARNAVGTGPARAINGLRPKFPTQTTLSGPATSVLGSAVTFTATVSGDGILPTTGGGVFFSRDNGIPIPGCSLAMVAPPTVLCTTNALTLGTHTIVAMYNGDAPNGLSISQTFQHTVTAPVVGRRADPTGNGTSDIIWYHTGVFGVIGMNANGLSLDPYYAIDVQPDADWKIVGLGDLDGDGKSDLVWHHAATGELYGLLLNGGTVLAEARIAMEPNLAWKPEQIADLNGDAKADIVWKNQATGDVFVMLMNGLAQAGGQVVYSEPNLDWKIVGSGDMNGDGKADLLWRNVATGDVFSMLMNGFTVVNGGVIYTEPNLDWKIIGLADYNADGKADVLWQNVATGEVFQMQMNGTQVSAGAVIYTEPNVQWQIVALGDYNGDGKADILWQNTVTGQVYMLLMNGFAVIDANFVYTEPDTQWRIVGP